MEGSDGKLYKVDMKNYGSDVREVYGVTHSQIATYDSPMKSNMMKTRPTSGKTMNVRPSSSKYLWWGCEKIKWIKEILILKMDEFLYKFTLINLHLILTLCSKQ